MQDPKCPKCGHDSAPDGSCPGCGQPAANGGARKSWIKPPPPPEVAGLVIARVPPEMAEQFRSTFNEEEYLAAVREMERTGGYRLEEFIDEIEQIAHGKE